MDKVYAVFEEDYYGDTLLKIFKLEASAQIYVDVLMNARQYISKDYGFRYEEYDVE